MARADRRVRPGRGAGLPDERRCSWRSSSAASTRGELSALTDAMIALRRRARPRPAIAAAQGRQALHRRRRRQDLAPASRPLVAACGVPRADDVRPRARPHRRHARQARGHPRLPRRPRARRASARSRARARRRHDRPDRRASPPPTSSSTRCATSPRTVESHPAHRAQHHVEEARRGHRRAGARREGRPRRLHEGARARARPRAHARSRSGRRAASPRSRAAHRHGASRSAAPSATPSRWRRRSPGSRARGRPT